MALAIDAVSSASDGGSPASLTWSHTCSGADRGLIVGTSWVGDGITASATYNGVPMISKGMNISANSSALRIEQFELIAPATGPNNVVVTYSSNVAGAIGGAVSFTGAHQTTLTGTQVQADGVAGPATVNVSSAADEIVCDVVLKNGTDTITVGADQAERWNVDIGASGLHNGGGSTEPGAGTVTMSWTFSGTVWIIAAVAVKPAAAGTNEILMAQIIT
jgi:hypothetical protein